MRHLPLCVLLALSILAVGCATPRTASEVDTLLSQTLKAAQQRNTAGDEIEAYQLAMAVIEVDSEYPGVQDLRQRLSADLAVLFNHEILGSNVAIREPADSSVWTDVLLYLPDRILDLLDVVSFDVHLGVGLLADVHVTRGFQLKAGFRSVAGLGWHFQRSLGLQTQNQAGFSALFLGAEAYSGMRAGTSGVRGGSWAEAGLHGPGDALYQDYRDYWAVGAGVTVGVVGVDVDLHLIQIYDLLAGLLTIDPLNDDFASTRGVDVSSFERQLLRSLGEVASDEAEVQAYQLWRAGQGAAGHEDLEQAEGSKP